MTLTLLNKLCYTYWMNLLGSAPTIIIKAVNEGISFLRIIAFILSLVTLRISAKVD